MTVLQLVPNQFLRKWRQVPSSTGGQLLPFTIPSLAAKILKEHGVPYRDDKIMEEIAVWQSLNEVRSNLQFFAPIAHYPGFVKELQWLFRQMDLGEKVLGKLPVRGRSELELLHQKYHECLAQHNVLDGPGQIGRAIPLASLTSIVKEASEIELIGLGDLSPLETEFIQAVAGGRKIRHTWSSVEEAVLEVRAAEDPYEEVETMGLAIRKQLEQGLSPEDIGVAFPNPRMYMPIIIPIFERLQIPWRMPAQSLRSTPLGKAVLTLLVGELEGWHKHHLELLTVPGWGFPFELTLEEHRVLRLAPPLKGLPAWREYLTSYPGWGRVLEIITAGGQGFITKPVKEHVHSLRAVLSFLEPEKWFTVDVEQWALLVKSWDGLWTILENLDDCNWEAAPSQFVLLLESLMESYQIRPRRSFQDRLSIISVDELGAHTYRQLYAGGLVEGQFPPQRNAHWLTKEKAHADAQSLYERLIGSADEVFMYYPETDRDGKLNLPASVLPKAQGSSITDTRQRRHTPSLFLGDGFLQDSAIKQAVQDRILKEGLSTSQLNIYARCPYQFFCTYVLGVEPHEEDTLELTPSREGSIIHKVLCNFWQTYLNASLPSLDEAQIRIEQIMQEEYHKEGQSPAERVISQLRLFVRNDLTLVEQGFRPQYLEMPFRGLAIPTEEGPVELRGIIDRIDLNSQGDYVLYDYKTGGAPTLTEILSGGDVQIATYLLAAKHLFPQARNVGVAYYLTRDTRRVGIFRREFHKQLMVRGGKNCLGDEDFLKLIDFFQETIQGLLTRIFNGEFPIRPSSTSLCRYCPYQGICRKEGTVNGF